MTQPRNKSGLRFTMKDSVVIERLLNVGLQT